MGRCIVMPRQDLYGESDTCHSRSLCLTSRVARPIPPNWLCPSLVLSRDTNLGNLRRVWNHISAAQAGEVEIPPEVKNRILQLFVTRATRWVRSGRIDGGTRASTAPKHDKCTLVVCNVSSMRRYSDSI